MRNVLVLKSNKDSFEKFYIERMQSNRTHTYPIYRFGSGIGWTIQVLWIEKLNLPFKHIWYGKWWREIKKYDSVIIFDRNLSWSIVTDIKKQNDIRIIAWYWNCISNKIPEQYENQCEVWSFDKNDCMKFSCDYNTQFYFRDDFKKNNKIKQDVFFIGRDKNRVSILKELETNLVNRGISTNIILIKDDTSKERYDYKMPLEYNEILEEINSSNGILDVPQPGQGGMTVRVLESIFLRKKLLTINVNIKNEDFYDVENMYVWGYDDRDLKKFLEDPYVENSINVFSREYYSFTKWIERFEYA